MRIVVDTNVIASAVFFGGKPYQLLHYNQNDSKTKFLFISLILPHIVLFPFPF